MKVEKVRQVEFLRHLQKDNSMAFYLVARDGSFHKISSPTITRRVNKPLGTKFVSICKTPYDSLVSTCADKLLNHPKLRDADVIRCRDGTYTIHGVDIPNEYWGI